MFYSVKNHVIAFCFSVFYGATTCVYTQNTKLPDTGISGVYEVMVGTKNAKESIRYFAEMGFSVVDSSVFSAKQAQELYGVASSLKSYRLQNGQIDSHGLVRLLRWEKPLGDGVGAGERVYAP